MFSCVDVDLNRVLVAIELSYALLSSRVYFEMNCNLVRLS
jgi:hypothetical protein